MGFQPPIPTGMEAVLTSLVALDQGALVNKIQASKERTTAINGCLSSLHLRYLYNLAKRMPQFSVIDRTYKGKAHIAMGLAKWIAEVKPDRYPDLIEILSAALPKDTKKDAKGTPNKGAKSNPGNSKGDCSTEYIKSLKEKISSLTSKLADSQVHMYQ
ncbi:hypothetical protein KIPB_009011 [Kipferlia bialata]|uniref:Uncharacterized protein n=1 Tax=Kipferlia bialata TaxID=797122 RepID=A0A391P4T9_9EUKA|nr:hypothetical protein KIPB_009011 [Kipferlia bialata]|eukprot:g9011.t1